jgi:Flp pilus assembly protein TadG
MSARSHRRTRDRGQALPEFALVAPIFFLLVFAVIQLGLVFGTQNGLVNGVREAARRAATYRINDASFDAAVWSSICDTVAEELRQLGDRVIPAYDDARLHPIVAYAWVAEPSTADPSTEHYSLVADVSATYDHPLYVPLVSYFLDRSDGTEDGVLTLTATEQMRVENPSLEFASSPTAPPACPAYP